MDSQKLIEDGLIRLPLIEQAMEWLVANGPVIEHPELPPWVLKRLVHQRRILRLRGGLYLAPRPDGQLPPFAALPGLLAPEGYVGFHAAFALAGLTDLDVLEWTVVVDRPTRPVRYGAHALRFFPSPSRVARAQTTTVDREAPVRVATPAEAICDALLYPRHAPEPGEILRVLRNGLSSGRIRPDELRAIADRENTPSFARRLGFFWSLVGGDVPDAIVRVAHRTHDRTTAVRGGSVPRPPRRADPPSDRQGTRHAVRDRRWRLLLPAPAEAIAAGARW